MDAIWKTRVQHTVKALACHAADVAFIPSFYSRLFLSITLTHDPLASVTRMHSTLSRLNAVSALATTIVLVLVVLIDLSRFSKHAPTGQVVINQLQVVRAKAAWHMDRNIQDFVEVDFNIDADFGPLFDWNTKQVFVSLAASYESKRHTRNEVVIWDRILRSKQDAHVALHTAKNKYGFREVGRSFIDISNTTFTLKYNIMPKVGLLHYGNEFTSLSMPIPAKQILPNGEQPRLQRLYY